MIDILVIAFIHLTLHFAIWKRVIDAPDNAKIISVMSATAIVFLLALFSGDPQWNPLIVLIEGLLVGVLVYFRSRRAARHYDSIEKFSDN
jgi:multisubunit Na+/H+ antiporter MnhB subunit